MKPASPEQVLSRGKMIMVYSETGVGKTTSLLWSAPRPIAYIQTEPRALKPSIDAANKTPLYGELVVGENVDVFIYENIPDTVEFLSNPNNVEKYSTVIVDGFTHLMNVNMSQEVTAEAYEGRSEKEKAGKPLASQVKKTIENHGVINQWMIRISNLLMKLSQAGKIIVCTALVAESPKWNRALSAAPALSGQEYPKVMPPFFDLIGKLEPIVKDGGIVYPPVVRFESHDDSFIAKYTGVGEARVGRFDLTKILRANGMDL